MNPRTLITFCLGAIPALAQAPASSWANVSTVSAKGVDAVGAPSLAVVGGAVDLGDVDGDRPVLGRIVIENRGAFPFSLLVPGLAATPCVFSSPPQSLCPSRPEASLRCLSSTTRGWMMEQVRSR